MDIEMESDQDKAIKLRLRHQSQIRALQFAVFCTGPLAIESKDGTGVFKDVADYDLFCEIFRRAKVFSWQPDINFAQAFLDFPAAKLSGVPDLFIDLDYVFSSAEKSTLEFCGNCILLIEFFRGEIDSMQLSCGCSTSILNRLDYDIAFCDEGSTESEIGRLAGFVEAEEKLQLQFLEALCIPGEDVDFQTLSAKFMAQRIWIGQYMVKSVE